MIFISLSLLVLFTFLVLSYVNHFMLWEIMVECEGKKNVSLISHRFRNNRFVTPGLQVLQKVFPKNYKLFGLIYRGII